MSPTSKTPDVVAKEILAKLAVTAPGFSLEKGTPERKIVDAAAEAVSEAYIDQYLIGSLLDIESKAGLELEQWVGVFGYGRLQGQKASGTVRVELSSASAQDITIPQGSQFYTRQSLPSSGNPLFFSSTQAAVIPSGTLVIDIPVECASVGTSGNVAPDSIVYVGNVLGATRVTNLQSFTGGVDVETDDELRQRFKNTFLRNVVGTEDWYLGLAYQHRKISKAVCFGPIRKYATQVEMNLDTLNLSDVAGYFAQDIKYAWPGQCHVHVFKDLGQDTETWYRIDDDFQWVAGASPQLKRIPSGAIPSGAIVDLEFEYTTQSSRNSPSDGISNKVDMFVNGSDPYTITERTLITDSQVLLGDAYSTDALWKGNYARVGSAGVPTAGHRFMRLGSAPIISVPSSLVIDGDTYLQGVDYHLLRLAPEVHTNAATLMAGSPYEVVGLEWEGAVSSGNVPVTITYTYNRVPELLQAVVKTGKQLTTDVMVHQANYAYLRVHLAIEYDRGFVVSQVNNSIQDRLRTFFSGLPYGAWIEVSDVLLAVRQVLGVDNVKIVASGDPGAGANHGIKVYGTSTDTAPITTHDDDFKLRDSELPIFLDAVISRRANR